MAPRQMPPTDQPRSQAITDALASLPDGPGVYLMKAADGSILYVGKARDLSKRVPSYFSAIEHHDPKTAALVAQIASIETILTATEKEALILEASLIKRHRPRYNVNLKDDKRYPVLRIDLQEPFPHIVLTRKIRRDGALYFGPYSSSQAVRATLKVIDKTFKLRKCSNQVFHRRTRPCLNYQIGTCLGPCCLPIDRSAYNETVKEVILFLKGRTPELLDRYSEEMYAASEALAFERAAVLRDKLQALKRTLERQVMVAADFGDRDIVAVAQAYGNAVVTQLVVRSGVLMDTRHFHFNEILGDPSEVLGSFLRQFYGQAPFVPGEIFVSDLPDDSVLIQEALSERRGRAVRLHQPRRGRKLQPLQMASANARKELSAYSDRLAAQTDFIERLQKRLRLAHPPRRIECFDNSHLMGSWPVSAMVVFEDGKPAKEAYRRYRLKWRMEPDDYAQMAEVMGRRYGKGEGSEPLPDLLLIDGGKGQLNTVLAVLDELGLRHRMEVAAIAKRDAAKGETQDKIFRPARQNPILFGRETDLRLFLERIRDEAHRFVIRYHRQRRNTKSLHSSLDEVPGIGPKRKALLMKHFGGIKKIRAATPAELSALPGITSALARQISAVLNSGRGEP
ncbi:MAG: excinuclease ABC subunit UvrC [Desulfosarcinaceae bacterium]|nr:excinuclease ABC subunit UvrC [Desulfosarcinaceae bacterium]